MHEVCKLFTADTGYKRQHSIYTPAYTNLTSKDLCHQFSAASHLICQNSVSLKWFIQAVTDRAPQHTSHQPKSVLVPTAIIKKLQKIPY
ncbi:hypothetical protein E2C01_006086 [Portunus trituberculatus]|uniref:Uncharacterized protein n=1 Tax=Portunus trituberculatus TaxID=210409 RepID=A0A5B7CX75_PORTR|nr:hypothetical protein [Portunus trituberculatus]